jgi:hypothetical protein
MDEDSVLMARLREMFTVEDAPPVGVTDLARRMYSLRMLDAEMAALTADSGVDGMAVAVRGDQTRLLTFESDELAIEIEVTGTGRARRVVGQLVPATPATLEARQPSAPEPRTVTVDERGRFVIEDVRPEPLSLTCRRPGARPVTTQWTGVA